MLSSNSEQQPEVSFLLYGGFRAEWRASEMASQIHYIKVGISATGLCNVHLCNNAMIDLSQTTEREVQDCLEYSHWSALIISTWTGMPSDAL